MKLHLLIILILILSFVGFGQNQTTVTWQTFTPPFEEFSVEVPTGFESDVNNKYDQPDWFRRYQGFQDNSYYFVFSDSLTKPYMANQALKFIGQQFNKDAPRAQFKFVDRYGFYYKIFIVKTGKRFYTFQTVSETENNEQVEKFFNSIKISGEPVDTKEFKTVFNDAAPADTQPEKKASGSGSGTGIGTGSGNGDGSRSGNGVGPGPPTPSTQQTTPLKILSKAAAKYTIYARDYQITGSVKVRITFLANGTIGSVTPYQKLPFGLTESAIEAAKRITFEPQKLNGQPYNVAKVVEYTFML